MGAAEGAIAGQTWRRSRPMMGPHRHLRTIDTAGGGAPKTAGGGYGGSAIGESGKRNGHRPPGRGIISPRRMPLDNRLTSRADWACETTGSGQVSGAVVHLSKHMLGTRRGDAIADRMLGMGEHRPAVMRGRTIGRNESGESACLAHK